MLHYWNKEHFSFRCDFCGERLVPKWNNPDARSHNIENDLLVDPNSYAISEEDWLASPKCCKILNPLDLTVFERVESSSSMGYRHDADAIKIDDKMLADRLSRYTPLIRRGGVIYRFAIPDPRHIAFTMEPKNMEPVEVIDEITVAPSHHGCAYYGFFKPSIAEALAQLPTDPAVRDRANAFYLDTDHIIISRCGGGQLVRAHWVRI